MRGAGALFILRGSLAPGGAVVKASRVTEKMWKCTMTAAVYENEGHEGSPGHARNAWHDLRARGGLGDSCALVTDGKFFGATHRPAIGYVTPEAARGVIVAVLEDGDQIAIDLAAHKLDHLVEESEVAERWKAYVPPQA